MLNDKAKNELVGAIYGILAYTAWGLLPLYWKLLYEVPAGEILAHRMFWSFIFIGVLLIFSKQFSSLKVLVKDKKDFILITLCSVIITINWGTYIWAVNTNQVVETSMGYYINPLLVVLLSRVVLKERFNFLQTIAITSATIGVLIITFQYGKFPWIALTLAITFALYGLLKKLINVGPITGLALETSIIMPFALIFILFKQASGIGAIGSISISTTIVLLGTGIATATPLLFFANAAKRIRFSTIGFLQYIAPTLTLFLGVVIFKEPFTKVHLVSFSFIWLALIIYSISNIMGMRKRANPAYAETGEMKCD